MSLSIDEGYTSLAFGIPGALCIHSNQVIGRIIFTNLLEGHESDILAKSISAHQIIILYSNDKNIIKSKVNNIM